MKKLISLLLALVMLLLPMGADAAAMDNKNQIVQVLSMTEGTVEENVFGVYHLKEAQLLEYWEAADFTMDEDVELEHMTMIRQRDISNNGEPIECSFRAWGTGDKYVIAFFRPVDETEWSVEAVEQGEYLDVTFPGDGQYALAWAW